MAKSNSIGQMFNEFHPGIKLALIALICVIGYYVFKSAFSKVKAQNDIIESKAEIKVYQDQGEKPTFTDYEYKAMADDLYEAMDGAGTDDVVVAEVFNKLQNNLDFLKLVAAFGVRDGDGWQAWIDGDLSSSQKKAFNTAFNAKGITKQL